MGYWLLKSEPTTFSIDDLINAPRKTTCWEGVRNYQVRNLMRDQMRCKDLGFFYHSACDTPGIAGIVEIVKPAYPDFHAFDPKNKYFDPKSTPENPRWLMVDVKLKRKLKRLLPLSELRTFEDSKLSDLPLLRKGSRLSITPVTPKHWDFILSLE